MPLRFDEETHKIVVDAPSCTTIVNLIYPFDASAIPARYLQMGIEKGQCVHKQIEVYIKTGKLIGCPHNVKTHKVQFEFLKNWWESKHFGIHKDAKIYNELVMYGKVNNYELTGIADCIVQFGNEIYIIDWKTTKEEHRKKEAIQVYLYGELYRRFTEDNRLWNIKYLIVNSNKGESYELTSEEIEQGKKDALKGLKMYQERKEIEKIWD